MYFYTNIFQHKGKLLVRGVKDGIPFKKIIQYHPYVFIPSKDDTQYRTLDGKPVSKLEFDSIYEAKEFTKKYDGVEGVSLYGLTNFSYVYLYDEFNKEIEYDPSEISVGTIDIETSMTKGAGFPSISEANEEITAITLGHKGTKYVFGCGDYTPHLSNIEYFKCATEAVMLNKFLQIWIKLALDVITGWNIEFFDIPYLVNRITKVLGVEKAEKLSPWEILKEYEVEVRGKKNQAFSPLGITVLDYIALYKKFTYVNRESYKLDFIAEVELNENKLDFSEYENLQDLYEKNFQKFLEYNIYDVTLVERLDDKLKLIELIFAMAYTGRINYEDCLTTVRMWDVIIHNHLLDKNIVIPFQVKANSNDLIMGGYVKDPKIGMSNWVVNFDLDSLYPHLIMEHNISPEVFIEKIEGHLSTEQIMDGGYKKYINKLKEIDATITANLCVYSRKKRGFLPELMDKIYEKRIVYKKQLKAVKKKYAETKDKSLEKEISRLHNLQMAMKIMLNSAFGALANVWFRWYNTYHAEAITSSGQVVIQFIAKRINEWLNILLDTNNVDYIIAIDTDSVYITLERLVEISKYKDSDDKVKITQFIDKVCEKEILPLIERICKEYAEMTNAYDQKMNMKREAIADKAIWTAKKRYIMNVWDLEGVAYETPEIKMTGIEAVKSSTPASCRDALKKSFSIIMNEDEKAFQTYVSNFRTEFNALDFEKIAFPRGITELNKWTSNRNLPYDSGTPIHVKGAILFNKLLKDKNIEDKYQTIMAGEKIKFVYLKKPNPYGFNVISCSSNLPKEFKLGPYIDYDTQFEKAFLQPIQAITNTIGWNTEPKSTLESWFD